LVSLFSWFLVKFRLLMFLGSTLIREDFFGILIVFWSAEHSIKHGICLETYDVRLRGFRSAFYIDSVQFFSKSLESKA
jgi:hypothetical protein